MIVQSLSGSTNVSKFHNQTEASFCKSDMSHSRSNFYNKGGNANIGASYGHRSDHRPHIRQAGSGYSTQQEFGKSNIRPSKSHSQNSQYGGGYFHSQPYQHQRTLNPQQAASKQGYALGTNSAQQLQFHQTHTPVPGNVPLVKNQAPRPPAATSAPVTNNLPKGNPKDTHPSTSHISAQTSLSHIPGILFQHNPFQPPYYFEMPSGHQSSLYLSNPAVAQGPYQMYPQYPGAQQYIVDPNYYICGQGGPVFFDAYRQSQVPNVPKSGCREKRALQILHPDTGADVMKDVSKDTTKLKTDSSKILEETSLCNEIAAQFATAVAATLDIGKKSSMPSSRSVSPSKSVTDQEQTSEIDNCILISVVDISSDSLASQDLENSLHITNMSCETDSVILSNQHESLVVDDKLSLQNSTVLEITNSENDLSISQIEISELTCPSLSESNQDEKSGAESPLREASTDLPIEGNAEKLLDESTESEKHLENCDVMSDLKSVVSTGSVSPFPLESEESSLCSNVESDQQCKILQDQTNNSESKNQLTETDITSETESSIVSEVCNTEECVNSQKKAKPISKNGIIQYGRNDLLKYRSHPSSLNKPLCLKEALPDIMCIIKDKPDVQDLSPVSMQNFGSQSFYADPFMPSYMSLQSTSFSCTSSRRVQSKFHKIISTSLNQPVKLHESENAWKPTHTDAENSDSKSTNDEESEKIYKKVRSILNKLTPDNADKMCNNFCELAINTETRLREVSDLVFEKAIGEKEFTKEYAKLCVSLKKITVPSKDGPKVTFSEILLRRCQREFESDNSIETQRKEKFKEIKLVETEERRNILKEQWEEEEAKYKRKSVGYIKFIGCLFSEKMLKSNTMHSCLNKLLEKNDEESLEQFCNLIKTVGKKLEEEEKESKVKRKKNKSNTKKAATMADYISKIQQTIKKKQVSSRVRFMLESVVELKENKWIPRREESGPKQISEIHKDIEREEIEAQKELERFNVQKLVDQGKPSRYNSVQQQPSNYEWNTMARKGRNIMDLPKLITPSSHLSNNENIVLQPSCRGWGSGSTGGGKRKELEQKLPVIPQGNRFQVLCETVSHVKLDTDKDLVEEKVNELRESNDISNSTQNLRNPLSIEKVEQKSKAIIDELFVNIDYEEATCCIQELTHPNTNHSLVTYAINYVLEKTSIEREILAKFLHKLVKSNIISIKEYLQGLKSVLDFVDDYVVDIPLIWQYIGELVEPMFDETLKFSVLEDILEPCIASGSGSKLAVGILQVCTKKKGSTEVKAMWQQSELKWEKIFKNAEDIKKFLESNNLMYLYDKTENSENVPLCEVKNYLDTMLKAKQSSNEEIIEWLAKNLEDKTFTDSQFIRILVTSVIENALVSKDNSLEVQESVVKYRNSLLKKFLEQDEKLELQALYALQALMDRLNHPRGVLRHIFDLFYDEDVIAEETYRLWEKTEDPAEHTGRGVTLLSVSSFFTWLENAETMAAEDSVKPEVVL